MFLAVSCFPARPIYDCRVTQPPRFLRHRPCLMKASQFHFTTLRDAPADAEIVSHQLMMRAGFIKRLGAGIYTFMPLACASSARLNRSCARK